MKKRLFMCGVLLLALSVNSLSAFATGSSTVANKQTRQSDGTLVWDFEIEKGGAIGTDSGNTFTQVTNDIAPITEANPAWPANVVNEFSSGAWHSVSIHKENIHGSPQGMSYSALPKTISGLGGGKSVTVEKMEKLPVNCGDGFAMVISYYNYSKDNKNLAMAIKLEDTKLVPGVEYNISADVYTDVDPGEGYEGPAIYVDLNKPSEVASYTDNATRARKWVTGNQQKLYWTPEGEDATPKNRVEKSDGWVNMSGTFTPDASMYEGGYTILNLGSYEEGSFARYAYICFDNIVITPVDKEEYSKRPMYTKVEIGRRWDFEDDSTAAVREAAGNYPSNAGAAFDNTLTKAVSAENDGTSWAGLPGQVGTISEPRYIKTDDIRFYNRWLASTHKFVQDKGAHGASPVGTNSIRCATSVPGDSTTNWVTSALGMRLKIDKEEWLQSAPVYDEYDEFVGMGDGETSYKLSFKAANNFGAADAQNHDNKKYHNQGKIFAMVVPYEEDSANGYNQVKGWYDNAKANETLIDLGYMSPIWKTYTANITLTPENFSEDGYAQIVLVGLWDPAHNDGFGKTFLSYSYLFFDDVSLIRQEQLNMYATIGKKPSIAVTNVSTGKIDNVMTTIAQKNSEDRILETATDIYDVDGVTMKNIAIEASSNLEETTMTLFNWDMDTLMPFMNSLSFFGE